MRKDNLMDNLKRIGFILIVILFNEIESIEINNGQKSQKGTSGGSKTVRSIRFQKSEVNCKHTIESSFVMRKRNKKPKYNI